MGARRAVGRRMALRQPVRVARLSVWHGPVRRVALLAGSRRNPRRQSTPNRPTCRSSLPFSSSYRKCIAARGCYIEGCSNSSRSPRSSRRGFCPFLRPSAASAHRISSTTASMLSRSHQGVSQQHSPSPPQPHRSARAHQPPRCRLQATATPGANTPGSVSSPRIVHRCGCPVSMCEEPSARRTPRTAERPLHSQTWRPLSHLPS